MHPVFWKQVKESKAFWTTHGKIVPSRANSSASRQHVIMDQSVNYVGERFIIDEGHTTQRLENDYGYDLLLFTFDEQGYVSNRAWYFCSSRQPKILDFRRCRLRFRTG